MLETMTKMNARIPSSEEEIRDTSKNELYYVVNTLVPVIDWRRIIGPLTREQLEQKRKYYDQIVSHITKERRSQYSFRVYKLELVE